ncbi:hypothetical protein [Lacinutrix sp.]|uniref:hypothetical protein n=1 Tax=Lacinutrix sp. TaxID=1937692 RepID=UPI0025C3A7C7|nr:hypothetical protein [Lacinutrix sp.]
MRYILLMITFIFTQFSNSQTNQSVFPITEDNDYFHNYNIENFYLHTNKSLYFAGESVFLKAYVVNESSNKPNLETKNLHVNLYDFNNQLVFSTLFFVQNGKSYGSIKLPKDLKSGEYTLQLNTQWNRNFKKGSNFPITIQNIDNPVTSFKTTDSINNTSITFFAEGGSLLKDVKNTIYFKVKTDNNQNIIGRIVDAKTNEEVSKIYKVNSFYGKSNFTYNSNFIAVLDIDGKEQKIILPNANTSGFVLQKINDNNPNSISFDLITNLETIKNKKNKFVQVVLHKKGLKSRTAKFTLSETALNYNINFPKSDIYEGYNTVTVFDDKNNILTERPFYYKRENKIELSAETVAQTKDSATLDIKLANIYNPTNISISVLHEDSQVIDYNSQITKSLLSENYNKELKEDLDIYFQDNETNFLNKLIANKKILFKEERGLTLKGHVNTKLENPTDYKVTIANSKKLLESPLDSEKNFQFNHLLITHPSEFALLLLNKEEQPENSQFYIYDTFVNYSAENTLEKSNIINSEKTKITASKPIINNNVNFPLFKDVEKLREVVLEGSETKQKKRIKEIKKDNPFLVINKGSTKDYLIDPEKDFLTLGQYLQNRITGLRVIYKGPRIIVYNYRGNGSISLATDLIKIVLDGIELSQGRDDNVYGISIGNRSIQDFELISVNLSGLGNGITAENGVVNLISRRGRSFTNIKDGSSAYKTSNGFSQNNESINDNNLSYPSQASENAYSAIDWIPNVTLTPNNSNIIKIKKPQGENVKLIINGISDNGDLIYKAIDL